MWNVYPIGYSVHGANSLVDGLMEDQQVLLIDTRINPKSWRAEWRFEALQQKWGKRYRGDAGRVALGNTTRHIPGQFTLVDPRKGIKGLLMYLADGYDLILLCQCPNYHACHRSIIVALLVEACKDKYPLQIIHPSLSSMK